MDFYSTENVWENTNIPKLCLSQIFWAKLKLIQFSIYVKSGFPQYEESMEKHKYFKFMDFLNILGEAEIDITSKTWRNSQNPQIFSVTEKSIQLPKHVEGGFPQNRKSNRKHKHFKFMDFLNISGEAEIHTIPKTWRKRISIVREKYGKTLTFQIHGFLKYFW